MKNKQKIIILGGAGFIGSHLASSLLSIGCQNIIVIDRYKLNNKKVKYFVSDFSDAKKLAQIIKPGDIVIHLACSTIPASSEENKIKDLEENVIPTINLLDLCVKKKIKKFIFASSGGTVYGDLGKKAAKESDSTNPLSAHGVMKLTIENYLKLYHELYGLDYIVARIANPYGRKNLDNKNQGLIDVMLAKIKKNEIIKIWGDGKIIRDYIYIQDAVDFFVKAIFTENILNQTFNVGTGKGASINQVLEILQKLTKKKLKIKYSAKRNFDLSYNVLNIAKAKKELNWQPKFNLEEGIKQIINL